MQFQLLWVHTLANDGFDTAGFDVCVAIMLYCQIEPPRAETSLRQTQVKECRSWICRMQILKENETYQKGPSV